MDELGRNHPLRRLRALRLMSRLLTEQAPLPSFSDTDLADVVVIAAEERLSATVALALDRHALLDRISDSSAHQLRWARRHVALSQLRFEHQLTDALKRLEAATIPTAVLKGGALLVDAPSQPLSLDDRQMVAAREMSDIDLLVAPTDHLRAQEILAEAGYHSVTGSPVAELEPDHATTMVAAKLPGPLDLHRALGMAAGAELMPVEELMSRATPARIGSASCLVLAPGDALVHTIWHAQMQNANYRYRILPTRQLHSCALFLRAVGSERWPEVRERYDRAGFSDILDAQAEQLRYLFGIELGRANSPRRARRHLRSCLASFALAGVADARRNLAFAFAPDYLRIRYGNVPLPAARVRHLGTLLTRPLADSVDKTFRTNGIGR